jgi:subtilisin family serine protease
MGRLGRRVAAVAAVGSMWATPILAAAPPATPSHTAPSATTADRPQVDPSSVLVRFGSGLNQAARRRLVAAAGGTLGADVHELGWTRVATGRGNAARVQKALRGRAGVAEVQPNYVRRIAAVPNDPLALEQESIGESRFSAAWAATTGSPATKVAIVDTGVDLGHPDLVANLNPGRDFVNADDQADDDNGHGTMVAGVAAATGNNAVGVAGTSWASRIIPVKVLNDEGEGDDATIAAGIAWAADQGADVINLSLGGPGSSAVLEDAIRYARAAGAVIVAPTGNDGSPFPSYPAASPGVIAVAATDVGGNFASFSNSGPWVDIAAPGVDLLTTCLGVVAYCGGTGTSFAAPLVSGAALLVRSLHPGWSAEQVETALRTGARDRGPRGIDPYFGAGLLDAHAALGGTRQPRSVPPADAAEPNDTPARATPIADAAIGSISIEGDVDWYAVSMPSSGPMTVTVTPTAPDPAGGDHFLVIEAFGPDMRFVTGAISDPAAAGAATVVFRPPAAGVYRIAVRTLSGERAPYTVDVAPGDPLNRFWPYEAIPAGSSPVAVAIGDVTGDGLADALVTTRVADGPRLLVFAQTPYGFFADPIILPAHGVGGIAVGDLDGDGLTDAAVAAPAGVQVYLQSEAGLADPVLQDGTSGAHSIQAADMDGDGRLDLVYAHGGGVSLLRNEPASFVRSVIRAKGAGRLRVGEVTGDGRPDVVTVEEGEIVVTPGTADGSFGPPAAYPTGLGWLFAGLDVADVTGDGRGDVIISHRRNSPDASIVVYPQLSDGTIGAGERIATLDIPEPVQAADVNGDGRSDVVTLHGGWQAAGVLLQRPDGGLGPEERTELPYASNYGAQSLAVGDVDADGLPDVLAADYNHGLVVLYQRPTSFPPGEKLWVQDTAPADLTSGASGLARPTVSFARSLDPATVSPETVILTSADTGVEVQAAVAYSAAARTVTLTPAPPLRPSGTYVVTVDGVKDVDGNALDWPVSTRFTVAPGPFTVSAGSLAPGTDRRVTGAVARVSDAEDLGETGHYEAVIEWGDGRSSVGQVIPGGPGSAVIVGDHTYAAAGRHAVTVSVKSSDGRTGQASAVADVAGEQGGTDPGTPPVGEITPPSPQPPAVRLTGLRASAARVRAGGIVTLRLRLSAPAVVDITVRTRGRVVKRLRARLGAGNRSLRMPARIGRKPLRPGTYLISVSAASAAGPSATARTRIVITPAGPQPKKRPARA